MIALGVACALPFSFENFFFISWFSFAPLLIFAVNEKERMSGKAFFASLTLFFFFYHFAIYYFFMALVPMSFVGLGVIASFVILFLAWVLFSLIHALPYALAFYLIAGLKASKALRIIALSLSMVCVSFLQSFGTYGFTWARFSLPQSALLPTIQSASLFGPYFVDIVLMLVNAIFSLAFVTKKYARWSALAVLLFALNYFFGVFYMSMEIPHNAEREVVAVQGNVLMNEKWHGRSSFDVYMDATKKTDSQNKLIIWPETAVTADLNKTLLISERLSDYSKNNNCRMIVGGFYLSNVGREYNGAYYISEGEIQEDVYFKRKLVPFGEFLPMRFILENIPFLDGINLNAIDLKAGEAPTVFETDAGGIGPLICFDSIFPYLARSSVNNGADLLVILTNDSWFKDFPAVFQHNNQARWRAVENGRWVVRAANSGVSSIITPHGVMTAHTPCLVSATVEDKVFLMSEKTLYTKIGDVIFIPILLFFIILVIKQKKTIKSKAL